MSFFNFFNIIFLFLLYKVDSKWVKISDSTTSIPATIERVQFNSMLDIMNDKELKVIWTHKNNSKSTHILIKKKKKKVKDLGLPIFFDAIEK